ncbi:MAG: family 16 glycosylhydrolase, partial [Pseudomonadota bacterium]
MGRQGTDSFDSFDTDFWNRSDFAIAASFNQTAWEADHVELSPGLVTLRLDGEDQAGKPFTGAQIQSEDTFGYGSYEMTMRASGESGVVSSFFMFTSEFFGAERQNEIDFEFLGNDTTKVQLNYYFGSQKLGDFGQVEIDLGFDAAAGFHDYRIDWAPDAIRWFVDDRLVYEVRGENAPVPIPNEEMLIYGDIWTGDTVLEAWHGPIDPNIDTTAAYDAFSYREFDIDLPVDADGAVTFAGTAEALFIDMANGSYSEAAKVLAIGDSITLGVVDTTDPTEIPEEREGWRQDFFDNVVGAGAWIDYVGFLQNGPDGMMDQDHSAIGGMPLRNMVRTNGSAAEAEITSNLDTFAPDIVLLMAGTNDYNNDVDAFFQNRFRLILENMDKAIDQFLEMPGSDQSYLVISTLAPKTRQNTPAELAEFLNEGFSMVNGQPVAGNAGNGTWTPGLRALVEGRGASNPNILLFDNPMTAADLTADQTHFTQAAYARYAQDLAIFLEAEIGLDGGTLGGDPVFMQDTLRVVGGDAGDRIVGSDGNDTIDGGGGSDLIDGGSGADTIIFGSDTLSGSMDVVTGFSVAGGDTINLARMAADLGLTAGQMLAALTLSDVAGGTRLTVSTTGGPVTFAEIQGVTGAQLQPAISADPLPSADEDRNLSLTAPDLVIDGNEAPTTILTLAGLDADATAVITLTDRTATVTQTVSADGDHSFDISGLAQGGILTSVTVTDSGGASLTLPGPTLSLFGAPPDTADDDGNMTLTAPDLDIDETEVAAVSLTLSGLDADATAVITVSDGTTTVTSGTLAADGTAVLDLTGLADGALTTSVTATDSGGNVTTVFGPDLDLQAAPDNSADADGNLALSAPDLEIDVSEVGSVTLSVSGLDADATAVVTVT